MKKIPDNPFDKALDNAYRATDYQVGLPEGLLTLRVGELSPCLEGWLKKEGASCWSLLSAANPGSARLPEEENKARQEALRRELSGYRIFAGENHAHFQDWPVEPTFFVVSMPQEEAMAMSLRFGQKAFLWGAVGFAPQLIWCCGKIPVQMSVMSGKLSGG